MNTHKRRNGTRTRARLRVAVVGAGPAGLAVSRRLADDGHPHVVLERGQIGWSWRTQRWDSFRLNTPLWANRVPGEHLPGPEGSFATAGSLVAGLERLADGLPVVEGVEVRRAERSGGLWQLRTSRGPVLADEVVVASGFQNVPRRPAYADLLPADIQQLHVADYRSPDEVRGAVLVVGGGQSGIQIAQDLVGAGHRVYLSTSRVARLPRRYRGRDAYEWLRDSGQLEIPSENADPELKGSTPPQVSGATDGRTVSYQQLAADGVTLLGRVVGCDGRLVRLAPDLGANVRYADEASIRFRAAWDRQAALNRRAIEPAAHDDPSDEPAENLYESPGPRTLDVAAARISTVVWATGFGASTGWLAAGALDDRARPRMPGLHVMGAPWLTHRSSANLYGMSADAERLACAFSGTCARAAA